MARKNLSQDFIRAMMERVTSEVLVVLLTLTHPNWAVTIRRALTNKKFNSRSEVYFPAFFVPVFPAQEEGDLPRWRVSIDGLDQQILENLRSYSTPKPEILVEVVRSAAPDVVEMTTGPGYSIFSYTFDLYTIVAEIALADLVTEGYPGNIIGPHNFAAGF